MSEQLTQAYRVEIAKQYGIVVAVVYEKVKFWGNRGTRKDKWVYKSYKDMTDETGLSEKQIRLAYKKLVERGVIETTTLKVEGAPTLHFRICPKVGMESDQRSETMESAQRSETYIYTEYTRINSDALLTEIIALVNPKEKPTADRGRSLKARLREYTADEIRAAARAFSKSDWHRANKQMSIDNLLAPSKFGRWYQAGQETGGNRSLTREELMARMGDLK